MAEKEVLVGDVLIGNDGGGSSSEIAPEYRNTYPPKSGETGSGSGSLTLDAHSISGTYTISNVSTREGGTILGQIKWAYVYEDIKKIGVVHADGRLAKHKRGFQVINRKIALGQNAVDYITVCYNIFQPDISDLDNTYNFYSNAGEIYEG
jgi:hypothetical protein